MLTPQKRQEMILTVIGLLDDIIHEFKDKDQVYISMERLLEMKNILALATLEE